MRSKPMLIVKTGQTVPTLLRAGEDFEQWIAQGTQLPAEALSLVDAYADAPLPALDRISAMIITGSPAMVTDREPWSERCAVYIREALAQEVPILGICYGHQLLAHACGGEVGYHPQGREIGTVLIRLAAAAQDDALLAGKPLSFKGHTTHSQSVLRLPTQATLLASSTHDPHQAFRIGRSAWGVQFHPEFDARVMRVYVQERQQELRNEGFDVDALLAGVAHTPAATQLLRDFALLVATPLRHD